MAALLQLPVELRLQIYSLAIPSTPNGINIDEGATSSEPPRSTTARALMQIDPHLAEEMMPLYWNLNTFVAYRLTGMGHYISTDRTFYRWMREIVRDSLGCVRYLRFKGAQYVIPDAPQTLAERLSMRTSFAWEMQLHEADCIMTVDIDIYQRHTAIFSKKNEPCTCSHARALSARMNDVLARVPTVEGRVRPTCEVLWDLFESWYVYHPIQPRLARSWGEFQLHYGAHGA